MTVYRLKSTGEINPHITAETFAEWVATGHPKANAYEAVELPDPPAPAPVIPASVRNAQLRQWLLKQPVPDAPAGYTLFDAVEAKLSDPAAWPSELDRRKAYQRWEYEVNVLRTDLLVIALAADLGMSPEQLDAAFIQIAAIP